MIEQMLQNAYHWIELHGLRIVLAIVILIGGQWLILLIKRYFLRKMHKKGTDDTLKPFLTGLIAAVLQIGLVLGVIQFLNIQMTIFAALVGAIGVAAGLALSGTLQNFTSGVLILLLKPYEAGDVIVAQGQTGEVSSVQLFNTIIITADNKYVIIPNSKLSNEVIINQTRSSNRRIDIELKLSYAYSLEQVKPLILKEAVDMTNLTREPPAVVSVSGLEPDGWKLVVYAWVDSDLYDETRFELHERVIAALKQGGIKLPGM
ncbi:mechanosensitive ion channel family protein [Chitinophaga niabensis]|uniref:Small conductance mechanosensitive channel n=1 Tax=Chitinophaga niabensis TaxID=536979 RepID=A0A1N6D336_9BACT|nr:mechanosensitive ion channel family protein [Chitinophaga niabensis]SIN65195.1 small conductance mechanosensitive channel [Chitinophaga niabensis]